MITYKYKITNIYINVVSLALTKKTNIMKSKKAEWSDNIYIPLTPRTQLQDQVNFWIKDRGSFNVELYLQFCKLKKAIS